MGSAASETPPVHGNDRSRRITLAEEVYNSITWVNIPAGEFKMGDSFSEGYGDELHVHTVYLDQYYVGKYEVTFDQYDKFCEATASREV